MATELTETVRARGHDNVRANHQSTLEVTREEFLTPAGDCILGIEADRAPADFDPSFMAACRDEEARIELTLAVADHRESILGHGSPELTFASDRSLVVRTSRYVDDRTVMLGADGAATDVDRSMITRLQAGASLEATLRVRGPA